LLEKVYRMGLLLDTYGDLLTERQKNFVKFHYLDDCSFGEIAKEYNISRQAVYDAVKVATETLEEFEAKLRLVANNNLVQNGQKVETEQCSVPTIDKIKEMLIDLRDAVAREGIIYDTDSIAKKVDEVIARLG